MTGKRNQEELPATYGPSLAFFPPTRMQAGTEAWQPPCEDPAMRSWLSPIARIRITLNGGASSDDTAR
jgi:hypothetical protein